MKLCELGEKRIISDIIIPLINPLGERKLAGDDCAVVEINGEDCVTISTDRVPADLVSFKLGLIDEFELGYYLAVLNISDVISSGAKPVGILLNLAFNKDFSVDNFNNIIKGCKKACDDYDCKIIGGDLSDSEEMNLTATSVGVGKKNRILYRRGCKEGDYVYASKYLGLTPTAFLYYQKAKNQGLVLGEEEVLLSVFRYPKLCSGLASALSKLAGKYRITCMDNTDGIYQSLHEIGKLNHVSMKIDVVKAKIHPVSNMVADYMKMDVIDLIFQAGADFGLIGTIDSSILKSELEMLEEQGLFIFGRVIGDESDCGRLICEGEKGEREIVAAGWNYYV